MDGSTLWYALHMVILSVMRVLLSSNHDPTDGMDVQPPNNADNLLAVHLLILSVVIVSSGIDPDRVDGTYTAI